MDVDHRYQKWSQWLVSVHLSKRIKFPLDQDGSSHESVQRDFKNLEAVAFFNLLTSHFSCDGWTWSCKKQDCASYNAHQSTVDAETKRVRSSLEDRWWWRQRLTHNLEPATMTDQMMTERGSVHPPQAVAAMSHCEFRGRWQMLKTLTTRGRIMKIRPENVVMAYPPAAATVVSHNAISHLIWDWTPPQCASVIQHIKRESGSVRSDRNNTWW